MAELAADAAGLLRELGVESAHVCGLSMGGMIAQELAIRFPERVRGLVLGGTTPGRPARGAADAAASSARSAARAAGGWRDGERSWLGEWLFSEEFRREQPERARELLRHFGRHRATPQGVWAHWWASVYHDTTSRLQLHPGADARHARRARRDGADLQRAAARRADPGRRAVRSCPAPATPTCSSAREASFELLSELARPARRRSPPGAPRTGVAARAEPLTRALGLPIGAARTGASLAGLTLDKLRRRDRHVAPDR